MEMRLNSAKMAMRGMRKAPLVKMAFHGGRGIAQKNIRQNMSVTCY